MGDWNLRAVRDADSALGIPAFLLILHLCSFRCVFFLAGLFPWRERNEAGISTESPFRRIGSKDAGLRQDFTPLHPAS